MDFPVVEVGVAEVSSTPSLTRHGRHEVPGLICKRNRNVLLLASPSKKGAVKFILRKVLSLLRAILRVVPVNLSPRRVRSGVIAKSALKKKKKVNFTTASARTVSAIALRLESCT